MGSPIQLYDSAVITSALNTAYLKSSQPVMLGQRNLQARFLRQPVNIRGIRFLLMVQNGANLVANDLFFSPGAYVQLRIKAGRHALTNDFVAMNLLSQRLNAAVEYQYGPGKTNFDSLSQRINWNFDAPLPLSQGESITIEAQIVYPSRTIPSGSIQAAGPWIIHAVAYGETIDKMPASYQVPYAADYIGVIGSNTSQENDLKNICSSPVRVRRLIGRPVVGLNDSQGAFPTDERWQEVTGVASTALGNQIPLGGYGTLSNVAYVRVFDENSKQMEQVDNVTFNQQFPDDTGCWPMDKLIAPGQSWRIQLPNQPPTAAYAYAAFTGSNGNYAGWIPMIGLVGSREEGRL
jgi:hypothetical protein